MSDGAFQRVCRADDVRAGRVRVVRVGVRQVGVTRVGDRLFAFKNTCPHAGGPLSGGRLDGMTIECARHRWRFDLQTGSCADQPLYELALYEARESDGWVEVRATRDEVW